MKNTFQSKSKSVGYVFKQIEFHLDRTRNRCDQSAASVSSKFCNSEDDKQSHVLEGAGPTELPDSQLDNI